MIVSSLYSYECVNNCYGKQGGMKSVRRVDIPPARVDETDMTFGRADKVISVIV